MLPARFGELGSGVACEVSRYRYIMLSQFRSCNMTYTAELLSLSLAFGFLYMLQRFQSNQIGLITPKRPRHSIGWGYTVPNFPVISFLGLTCPAVTYLSYCYDDNLCELIKSVIMGLADRRAHASTVCCFFCVCSIASWSQNLLISIGLVSGVAQQRCRDYAPINVIHSADVSSRGIFQFPSNTSKERVTTGVSKKKTQKRRPKTPWTKTKTAWTS